MTTPGSKGLPDDDCRPLRRGAGHREHGGTFPLPLTEIMPIRAVCALARYLQQRLGRKRAQQRLFREIVIALNSLSNSACRVLRDKPESVLGSSASPLPPTGSQSSVLRRVRDKVISGGPPPVELTEQEALTELLHRQDLYALQPLHLADYDLDKLRVIKGGVLPKDVVDLVSTSFAEVLLHPCSSMLRSSAELLHLDESEGPITPYWDPTLRRDERQRVELFQKLADLKILSFRVRARPFAGLFFVKKKDGMIRLIIDARQANRYHARPPHTSLGSSSALSGIDLSDECLLQTSGIGHISEIHLCGAGSDVRDGYYQFSTSFS